MLEVYDPETERTEQIEAELLVGATVVGVREVDGTPGTLSLRLADGRCIDVEGAESPEMCMIWGSE